MVSFRNELLLPCDGEEAAHSRSQQNHSALPLLLQEFVEDVRQLQQRPETGQEISQLLATVQVQPSMLTPITSAA